MKSRWKKPGKILNIGNRERGEGFPFTSLRLKLGIFAFVNQTFTRSMHVLAWCLIVGHAFAEKRKKIALREYKKLLRKTREERRQLQSSKKNDRPPLRGASQVSNAAVISEQVWIGSKPSAGYKQTEFILFITRAMFTYAQLRRACVNEDEWTLPFKYINTNQCAWRISCLIAWLVHFADP